MRNISHNSIALKSDFSLMWFLKGLFWQKLGRHAKSFKKAAFLTEFEVSESLRRNKDVNTFPIVRGRYPNDTCERVVKYVHADHWDMHHLLLLHEAGVLALLNEITAAETSFPIKFPKYFGYFETNDYARLELEYVAGEKMDTTHATTIIEQLEIILLGLDSVGQKLHSVGKHTLLPKKGVFGSAIYFPCHILRLVVKKLISLQSAVIMLGYFYRSLRGALSSTSFTFAHRDIHAENVIIQEEKIYLLDPAIAVWSLQETDAAIAARNFFTVLGEDGVHSLLQRLISASFSESRFWMLSLYHTVHYLSYTPSNARFYSSTLAYLRFLETEIIS